MNINEQLQPVVLGLVEELKNQIGSELKKQLSNDLTRKLINETVKSITLDANSLLEYTKSDLENKLSGEIIKLVASKEIDSLISNSAELKTIVLQEIKKNLAQDIIQKLATTELTSLIQNAVGAQIQARIEKFDFVGASEQELKLAFTRITNSMSKNLVDSANKQITDHVNQKLSLINLNDAVRAAVQSTISENFSGRVFPTNSIDHTSINFEGFSLSGGCIKGGIIENFGSTGIEDRSTHVQLTLMDHAVVFENPLYSPELQIAGNLAVKGQVSFQGDFDEEAAGFRSLIDKTGDHVLTKLNDDLFDGFSDIVFKKIQTDGLDLDKVKQNGKEIVSGNRLGYHIVDTNIQRTGVINDLQTSGENLLCDTLYVTSKRVGINTTEPSSTFNLWDQEVEIVMSKHSQDTGFIGSQRYQKIVVGSNNKQNLVLTPDGVVKIDHLVLGGVAMTSHHTIPNFESRAGHVVWNSTPASGQFIGWVCLGGANWSGFGKIE